MTEKKQTTDKEQELLEQTEKQTQLQEEDLDKVAGGSKGSLVITKYVDKASPKLS